MQRTDYELSRQVPYALRLGVVAFCIQLHYDFHHSQKCAQGSAQALRILDPPCFATRIATRRLTLG